MPQIIMVVKLLIALTAFVIGAVSAWNGVQIITARELKELEGTAKKALSDAGDKLQRGEKPSIPLEDLTKFIEAVAKLLGVKTGPGAFLCLFGLALGIAGYWVLTSI